jgi:hypothetical protein
MNDGFCVFTDHKNIRKVKVCINCERSVISDKPAYEIKANCTRNRKDDKVLNLINVEFKQTPIIEPKPNHPKPPKGIKKITNFLGAIAGFVADGMTTVTKEQYEERMNMCGSCEHLEKATCGVCKCYLPVKAKMRSQNCPLNKWPGDIQTTPIEH